LNTTGAVILTIAVGGTFDLSSLASSPNYVFAIQDINNAITGSALANAVTATLLNSKQMVLNTASELQVFFQFQMEV
jgi:hypothetical protein